MSEIEEALHSRGVSRLCHFSPFKNAHRIMASQQILCSERVEAEHPELYDPTDPLRLDEHKSHICTNIEFPNVWYLDKLAAKDDVYIDHLLFLISPKVAGKAGTEFCSSNAARGRGQYCRPGVDALSALYTQEVQGNYLYRREKGHPAWLPTDMQAEVLIPDSICLDDVIGVVVKSQTVAKRLLSQLELAGTPLNLPLFVSPDTFSQSRLRALRTGGPRPREEPYPA